MTKVLFKVSDHTANGVTLSNANITFWPTAIHNDAGGTITNKPFSVPFTGETSVELDPTTDTWMWRIKISQQLETVVDGFYRVPHQDTILFTELPVASALDIEPPNAWQAMARSTVSWAELVGDELILSRSDGKRINVGNVRGLPGKDSTTPGPLTTLTGGTVTKLPPGSMPTAEVVGTLNHKILNLGLVTGDPGLDGSNVLPDSEAVAQAITLNGPAKDALSTAIVAQTDPIVGTLVADHIASDPTVVNAAAAAVDANPKIAELESDKLDRLAMPATADFNDYTTPGRYSVSTSNGKTNIPFPISGSLDVATSGSIVIQSYTTAEATPVTMVRRRNSGTWGDWKSGSPLGNAPAGGTDFDTIEIPATYPINSGSHPNQPAVTTGTLEVLPLGSNLTQRFTTNELVPRMFLRRKTSTTWQAWSQPGAAEIAALDQRVTAIENAPPSGGGGGESPSKYGHTVRLARAKQLVGVRSSSRTQVALICDHGTVKFRDLIYPALQANGLTCTLALNSQKMPGGTMHDPALEVDTWDQVKTWQTAGIEMANHGRTHQDTDSMATLYAEIVTGHEELETALGKPVHSWVQPAASGDLGKWFGFDDGIRWDSWANTDAGRMILDRHAVATGTIYPIGTYQLTGEPPIGMQGHWFDRDDQIEPLKTKIVAAEAEKSGILLRLHPQYVGGQNTIAAITEFFEWLAAEKTAGRIDVVTLTQWALTRIEA